MLHRIVSREYRGTYVQERSSGAYRAEGFVPSFSPYFPYLDDFAVREKVHS
jgi:hypothetical protein